MKVIREYFGLVWDLAKNDFKTKYVGSNLGIIWAFIQPIMTILIYWIVFQFGLKIQMGDVDVPYILWFATGMVPWFFFSDSLNNGTNCFMEYNYLVKKVLFPVEILPLVKVISSFFVHLIFVIFLFFIYAIYGRLFGIHYVQLFYYCVCLFIYSLAVSYITSAVVIFFKDLGQIISIILQIGMWACPILWNYTIVPEHYRWILSINPLYYIIQGYRNSFYAEYTTPWDDLLSAGIFWGVVLVMIVSARFVVKKLKPHFADVL